MASVSLDQQIMERLRQLDSAQKQQVLEFLNNLQQTPSYTASELLRLPPEERARLVKAAFEAASNEDFETFEAYSEADLDG